MQMATAICHYLDRHDRRAYCVNKDKFVLVFRLLTACSAWCLSDCTAVTGVANACKMSRTAALLQPQVSLVLPLTSEPVHRPQLECMVCFSASIVTGATHSTACRLLTFASRKLCIGFGLCLEDNRSGYHQSTDHDQCIVTLRLVYAHKEYMGPASVHKSNLSPLRHLADECTAVGFRVKSARGDCKGRPPHCLSAIVHMPGKTSWLGKRGLGLRPSSTCAETCRAVMYQQLACGCRVLQMGH